MIYKYVKVIPISLKACGTCVSEVTLTKYISIPYKLQVDVSITDPATPFHPILFILKLFK